MAPPLMYSAPPYKPIRGSVLILVMTLLPIFAWLSIATLERSNYLSLNSRSHAALSALRMVALHDLALALSAARRGQIKTGTTEATENSITKIRIVQRLNPPKTNPKTLGLEGFLIETRTHSEHGEITLQLVLTMPENDPSAMVWHISAL